jgi:hypothetical protein
MNRRKSAICGLRLIATMAGLVLALAWPGILSGSPLQFSGSMVAVTQHTVWVRDARGLAVFAGLPDKGELSAGALIAKYKLGDQVRIRSVEVALTKAHHAYQQELRSLTYLRAPTEAELAGALKSRARRDKENLLPLPADEAAGVDTSPYPVPHPAAPPAASTPEAALLERAREVSKRYLADLPNFTVDSFQTNYYSEALGERGWREVGELQSEISFQGSSPVYRDSARTGVLAGDDNKLVPRVFPQNGFLRAVFDLGCDVTIKFAGRAVEAGTPVLVYHFASPDDGCSWAVGGELDEMFYASRVGSLFIGEADAVVRRLDLKAIGLPKWFATQADEHRGTWDFVRIGGERYLVPTSSDRVHWDATRSRLFRTSATYKNHRHFSVSSTVDFN